MLFYYYYSLSSAFLRRNGFSILIHLGVYIGWMVDSRLLDGSTSGPGNNLYSNKKCTNDCSGTMMVLLENTMNNEAFNRNFCDQFEKFATKWLENCKLGDDFEWFRNEWKCVLIRIRVFIELNDLRMVSTIEVSIKNE